MIENVYLEFEVEGKYYSQGVNVFPILNALVKERIQSYPLEYDFDSDIEKLNISEQIVTHKPKSSNLRKFGLKPFNDFFIPTLTKSAMVELFLIKKEKGSSDFYSQLVRRLAYPPYSPRTYVFFYQFYPDSEHSMRVIYW